MIKYFRDPIYISVAVYAQLIFPHMHVYIHAFGVILIAFSSNKYCPMFSIVPECQICQGEHGHLLHLIYCSPQHTTYRHHYGSPPVLLAKPWDFYYYCLNTHPFLDLLLHYSGSHLEPSKGSLPEGFTLRGAG